MANSETNLESMLWEAANILRGPVDASDFKAYVFPLLFLKRISDVYDEERAEALAESDGDEEYADLPEQHRFQIPNGSHWADLRTRGTNVGQAVQRAMREIEKANPNTLYGIFGDVQWTNKDRLSDELLVDLIDRFSHLDLRNSVVPNDLLGDAYEYLIKKFADLTNRKAGEFYTPTRHRRAHGGGCSARRLATLSTTRPAELVACSSRPFSKSGNLAVTSVLMLGHLFGQERNLTTAAIARMNLFLHGGRGLPDRSRRYAPPACFPHAATSSPALIWSSPTRRSPSRDGERTYGRMILGDVTSPGHHRRSTATGRGCST